MVNRKLTNKDYLRRLNHLPKTIKCGLHSGFHPCCIVFYITKKMWMNKKENAAYNKKMWSNKAFLRHINKYNGYVICPDCLKNKRFIKPRKCPKGSHCNHAAEQAGVKLGRKVL